MILEIRNIEQNSFKVFVKLSDTILQVKEKIESKTNIDIEDQKLVHAGNLLADSDRTVEECRIDSNGYVTLIYPSSQKKEVAEMIEYLRNESSQTFETSKGSSFMSQDDNLSEASSRDTTAEELASADQKADSTSIDSESDDLSCSALLESIPDVENLCQIMINDPVVLPKYLSKLSEQRPSVFNKILENQHAFIDILNTDECDSDDNEIKTVEAKDYEAIHRLVQKGYGEEMAKKVYRACECDESGAAELLSYLC